MIDRPSDGLAPCGHTRHYLIPDESGSDAAHCNLCGARMTGTQLAEVGISLEGLRLPLILIFGDE